ncbi:DnaA N-terminal domain-containing protein [uncultured Roseobacter sp.]|uniref:DnaA N-terminal domain-containing protein n=1 Tax=uncultured Roseobacter sp. TaxID=114847 RepID=UPI00260A1517|nr:DnaA N-terminal domain-containing protein [uncultured Roseobacter sp.]
MEPQKLTGPEAGPLKYDVLTALSVAGLNGSQTLQTSLMRLIALITARYNWRTNELSVGQRDMARMWSVNERTVKREMKRLTQSNLLICKRSGVRGRVGAYSLNFRQIAALSEPSWSLVGPDFDHRMRQRYGEEEVKVVQLKTYVRPTEPDRAPNPTPSTWQNAMANLAREHPNLFEAWFTRLRFVRFEKGVLRLKAPSVFVQRYIETHHIRLLAGVVEAELGPIDQVQFEP